MLKGWWHRWQDKRRSAQLQAVLKRRAIEPALWNQTLRALPFIAGLPSADLAHLRILASLFLDRKEFSGAHGLQVSDAQAVMVAAQACLPILHIAPKERPDLALAWYDSFVGIVLHAGEVRAQREWVDEDGVAHSGSEDLTGEALEGGPLMLAWSDVQAAGELAREAYNVVIHEFIHVMDLRDGVANGCPPMPPEQRRQWLAVMQEEYERFVQDHDMWQRFGSLPNSATQPLLDAYGSTSIDEFFPVAAEAYFTQREAFAQRHPELLAVFDGFFRPPMMAAGEGHADH
jgi:MtfA peptidase